MISAIVTRVRGALLVGAALGLMAGAATARQAERHEGLSEAQIDALAAQALDAFHVPGMAVAIVKDGELVFSKGYGVADIETGAPVDGDTVFQIASISKAFTSAALAILIDEGKIGWDTPVIDILPDFRMYDPYVTRVFTIKDLLTHRSGLPLGAGDLMFWPNGKASRKDVVRAMRHLKPAHGFRDRFAYDNLLYIVAGEVVAAVSGMPWEDFIETRIFAPLGMDRCRALHKGIRGWDNVAAPHVYLDDKLQTSFFQRSEPMTAAGSLLCSADSLAKWIAMQLQEGAMPDGKTLFSKARHTEMWTPVTPLRVGPFSREQFGSNFLAYALGWGLSDIWGTLSVSHAGGLQGMVTFAQMMPEYGVGVIVLTNQQNSGATRSLAYPIMETFVHGEARDWLTIYRERQLRRIQDATGTVEETLPDRAPISLPSERYAGDYVDAWYGLVTVRLEGETLRLDMTRNHDMAGTMEPLAHNTFVVRWDDRALMADAYISFELDHEGTITGARMKAVDPRTDFSFDFHHLELARQEAPAP